MAHHTLSKRAVYIFISLASFLAVMAIFTMRNQQQGVRDPFYAVDIDNVRHSAQAAALIHKPGYAIAPKLGNETAKAELGRAAWKLFHTTFARFPDTPKPEESQALESYIHLFQRLYPCGECAEHFGGILQRFPPQVSSRSAAAAWGCHVHNEVNKSLKKELFDCSEIGDFYDCGCADSEDEAGGSASAAGTSEDERSPARHRGKATVDDGRDDGHLQLSKEDYQRGG